MNYSLSHLGEILLLILELLLKDFVDLSSATDSAVRTHCGCTKSISNCLVKVATLLKQVFAARNVVNQHFIFIFFFLDAIRPYHSLADGALISSPFVGG
jgi:hypothetical protein